MVGNKTTGTYLVFAISSIGGVAWNRRQNEALCLPTAFWEPYATAEHANTAHH